MFLFLFCFFLGRADVCFGNIFYPVSSSVILILLLIQGCRGLVLALCEINLLMTLSSSDAMLSHNWFTGVEMSKFACKLLLNSEILFSHSMYAFL